MEELKEFLHSHRGTDVIEDAHMVARKKRKYEKWRAQVLDKTTHPSKRREGLPQSKVVNDVCEEAGLQEDPMGWGGMVVASSPCATTPTSAASPSVVTRPSPHTNDAAEDTAPNAPEVGSLGGEGVAKVKGAPVTPAPSAATLSTIKTTPFTKVPQGRATKKAKSKQLGMAMFLKRPMKNK